MDLGNKILKLRKKAGLSQEQLGERVNVTRQTISNWELGETTPNTEQLKLLSKNYNILNIYYIYYSFICLNIYIFFTYHIIYS